jgi:uncharacterized NAD(P)/FAD-binding protein YdhS
MAHDIVIIGGGLSGSQTVCALLEGFSRRPPRRRVRIGVVDEHAQFGRGYAYGDRSPDEALLIETVAASTPTSFQQWLVARAETGSRATAWEFRNRAGIIAGAFDKLYCPRRLFGDYQEDKFRSLISEADGAGLATVDLIAGRAVDLEQLEDRSFAVSLGDKRVLRAPSVVLAIGAIPRPRTIKLSDEHGYIEDPYSDGYRGVRAALLETYIHLVIVGSNASAIELIHLVETNRQFAKNVTHITTVSREGYLLPGTISSEAVMPDVSGAIFPSASSYIDSARGAVRSGRLKTLKGTVCDIRRHPRGLQVELESASSLLIAQVVVNCAGAGRMHSHSSPLLRAVQRRGYGAANAIGRGFAMIAGSQTIAGLNGVHVVGPLLNGDGPGTYVESILTVYESARRAAVEVGAGWSPFRLAAARL